MRWIVSALTLLFLLLATTLLAQPPKLIVPDKMDKPAAATIPSPITSVDGENLEQWMAKLKSPDASVRHAAIRVIPAFGTPAEKAVPIMLTMMIEDRDISVRTNALIAL